MTIIAPREQTISVIHIIRNLFASLLYHKINPQLRSAIQQHLDWIARQPHTYFNCEFSTVPELRMTRITIEISHTEIPPLSSSKPQ